MARPWRDGKAVPLTVLAFDAAALVWTAARGVRLETLLWVHLAIASAGAFGLMALDKQLARSGRRRLWEAGLLWITWLGGAAGTLCAMSVFRHKTTPARFRFGAPLALWLQLVAVAAASAGR